MSAPSPAPKNSIGWLVALLAGIGIASIGLFISSTANRVMDFITELRRPGFATSASATVSTSAITINTSMVPLPASFWNDSPSPLTDHKLTPIVSSEIEQPPVVVTSLGPEILEKPAMKPGVVAIPAEPVAPQPTTDDSPKITFDPKILRKAINDNLASVFTGDLPYILLKSGDRLYEGSPLLEGVTLEAISTSGVICKTPDGFLKIETRTGYPEMKSSEPSLRTTSPEPNAENPYFRAQEDSVQTNF